MNRRRLLKLIAALPLAVAGRRQVVNTEVASPVWGIVQTHLPDGTLFASATAGAYQAQYEPLLRPIILAGTAHLEYRLNDLTGGVELNDA